MDDAADILRHPKSKSNADLILKEATRRAEASNPERWEKLDQDFGSAKDWHKLATQKGYYHVIGELREAEQILIAEGYATALSVYEATGCAVVVALIWRIFCPSQKLCMKPYPAKHITILGDDDRQLPDREPPLPNVGHEKAVEAAREVGGDAIFPVFLESENGAEFTDFGDLARSRGLGYGKASSSVCIGTCCGSGGEIEMRAWTRKRGARTGSEWGEQEVDLDEGPEIDF